MVNMKLRRVLVGFPTICLIIIILHFYLRFNFCVTPFCTQGKDDSIIRQQKLTDNIDSGLVKNEAEWVPIVPHNKQVPSDEFVSLEDALLRQSDDRGYLLLSSVDSGYSKMALNLFLSSYLVMNITNYLMVSWDVEAATVLREAGVATFLKISNTSSGPSSYGTSAFAFKTHFKTHLILLALKLNLTVLIVDVDIVFLKNPLLHFPCSNCDMQMQQDGGEGNSGFYLVRPTPPAILLHEKALEQSKKFPRISNQKAIDRIYEKMEKHGKIKVLLLPANTFPYGKVYFEDGHRIFAGDNPCNKCIIVHNNWIVSMAAKQYRFKEHLLWEVDTNGYYSDPDGLYLTYKNPLGTKNSVQELTILGTAMMLGFYLQRILILPTFSCGKCNYMKCRDSESCALNSIARISAFDSQFGEDSYREHVFLQHQRVPQTVKSSVSDWLNVTIKGMEDIEILKKSPSKVLRISSLHNAKIPPPSNDWVEKLHKGIVSAGYRQY